VPVNHSMKFSTTVAAATTIVALASVATANPMPSPKPRRSLRCIWTCPDQDVGGANLNDDGMDYASNPFYCAYATLSGNSDEQPPFCTYDASTGRLMSDHDYGLCHKFATPSTPGCAPGQSSVNEPALPMPQGVMSGKRRSSREMQQAALTRTAGGRKLVRITSF